MIIVFTDLFQYSNSFFAYYFIAMGGGGGSKYLSWVNTFKFSRVFNMVLSKHVFPLRTRTSSSEGQKLRNIQKFLSCVTGSNGEKVLRQRYSVYWGYCRCRGQRIPQTLHSRCTSLAPLQIAFPRPWSRPIMMTQFLSPWVDWLAQTLLTKKENT